MPITTTRPRACSTINTASANTPSTRAASPVSAAASMSKVSRARRRACSASKGGSVAGTGGIRGILSTGHACAGGRFFALALAWTLLRTENTEGRRKARIASNHVLTRPHIALPVGRSAGCCGLPQPQAATHARLPGCGGAHRPPCAGADAELGRGAALVLSRWVGGVWDMGWQTALALSGVMAMSSTAIVVKLMAERAELESEHGRRVMGILLFQDLAVVPLLVLIPALSSSSDQLLTALAWALVKATVLVGILLTGGQRFMRWWLTLVARRKSEELFMLNLLLITLGLAWLTELAGLSLALGAFIAGVLVSETEYKHQVGTDIRPFHDVLLGLFFITIGMMLDWHILVDRWALVLALLTVPLVVKLGIILVLARSMGATTGVALRTGLYLAQAGEFGFVLLSLTQANGLVQPALMNPILAAMVLSMLATPFLIMYSNRIVMKLVASDWLQQSLQMTSIARKSINTSKHVIICGYGRCGQNLARMLEHEGIPYMALDLDPDRVRQAAAAAV